VLPRGDRKAEAAPGGGSFVFPDRKRCYFSRKCEFKNNTLLFGIKKEKK
jgi:hypothetical protein